MDKKEAARQRAKAWYQVNRGRALNNVRQYRERNKEKIEEYRKAHYPAIAAKVQARVKAWAIANPERVAANQRRWFERNREKQLASLYAWIETHPDRIKDAARDLTARRRQRVKSQRCGEKRISYIAIYKRDRGLCGICGKKVSFEQASYDHIVPIACDGPHAEFNLQVSHLKCNVHRNKGYSPAQVRLPLSLDDLTIRAAQGTAGMIVGKDL